MPLCESSRGDEVEPYSPRGPMIAAQSWVAHPRPASAGKLPYAGLRIIKPRANALDFVDVLYKRSNTLFILHRVRHHNRCAKNDNDENDS